MLARVSRRLCHRRTAASRPTPPLRALPCPSPGSFLLTVPSGLPPPSPCRSPGLPLAAGITSEVGGSFPRLLLPSRRSGRIPAPVGCSLGTLLFREHPPPSPPPPPGALLPGLREMPRLGVSACRRSPGTSGSAVCGKVVCLPG